MKTADIISLENIINAFSLESIERKLREIAVTIKHEGNPSTVETLENERHLFTLARKFQTCESSESAGTATTTLEKMAYWFSKQTALENYRALTLHCFKLCFEKNIPDHIDQWVMISLSKAFFADPIKYAGYLFWLLENNLDLRAIDVNQITQQFFAYHSIDLEVIKNTYQFFDNVSEKTTAFLHHFENKSSRIRGYINDKIQENTFRSYNVLGIQYNHPYEETFDHSNQEPMLETLLIYEHFEETIDSLYELFDWAFIERLDFEILQHRLIIEHILQNRHEEKFLISFSERILTGEVSYSNALRIIEKINTFWAGENYLEDDHKISLIKNYPILIHALARNINLDRHLKLSLEAFQDQRYQTLTHLPFLCRLYRYMPATGPLPNVLQHKESLSKIIFNIISRHGNTLSDDLVFHIRPIAPSLRALFHDFMITHQNTLTHAIEQFASDQIDFESVENTWGNQLSLVELAIFLFPNLKNEIKLPYDKYDLYVATIDKIAQSASPHTLNKFRQFLSSFQYQLDLPKIIVQETLNRTEEQHTIDLILRYISLDETFVDVVVSHAVKSLNFNLIKSVLAITKKTPHFDKIQTSVIDCLNKITTPDSTFLTRIESDWNSTLFAVLLPYFKNHALFIEYVKSEFTKAVNNTYNFFIISLLSNKHVSFLTAEFIAQTLLKKVYYFRPRDQETALLLCGMRPQTLKVPGLIKENNVSLYLSSTLKSIEYFCEHPSSYLKNPFLTVWDKKGNNILHLAAQQGDYQTLTTIFQALEKDKEDTEIFDMLSEKNKSGSIPCAPGDDRAARHINRYLKVQYEKYAELRELFSAKLVRIFPGNNNSLFRDTRKRSREDTREAHETNSDDSLATTVPVDDEPAFSPHQSAF